MSRFQNILVATDTRFSSHPAITVATKLAKRSGAKLKIVDVLKDFSWTVRVALSDHQHFHELVAKEKRGQLEALAETCRAEGIDVETKLLFGKSSVEIIKEVSRAGHDLVIRVSKGAESNRRGFFGTTGLRLLRKCPCPVWLVKPGNTARLEQIVGCVDTSSDDRLDAELNDAVFELTKEISEDHGGKYRILNAWSIYGEQILKSHMNDEDLAALERDSLARAESEFHSFLSKHEEPNQDKALLVRGEPAEVIANYVGEQDVDLLVMGTIGRSNFSGIVIGNTAEQIFERIECSVLALKPAAFNTEPAGGSS